MSIESVARELAIKNASKYGKADVGRIIQKLLGTFPEYRKDVKSLLPLVKRVVEEVNAIPKDELKKMAPTEKKTQERRINLPNAEQGKVVTRFPPEPSGYLHIGHAKAATLNFEAALAYDGKMLLRIDDTNPENARQEYEDAIKEDLQWLGILPDSVSYTSDSIEQIYEKARELISKGKAYVCFCSKGEISEKRRAKVPCEHRSATVEENTSQFEKMLSGDYLEGEALLRYKGDMESDNTAMRDPTLARIVTTPHYRKGTSYVVWPSYDLAVVVMDAEEGITHAIRSKEYELRGELYRALLKDLGYPHIELIHISRLFIPGYPISKREIRKLIEEGFLMGWDDPRLLTLRALRRRGILPDALRKFSLSFGLGKQENPADLELLFKENRKLLDKEAERCFFVPSPVEVSLKGDFPETVALRSHPASEEGRRMFIMDKKLFIPASDWDSFTSGEVIRLKDFSNAVVNKEDGSLELLSGEGRGLPKIQWIPSSFSLSASVLIPKPPLKEDGSFDEKSLEVVEGVVEKTVESYEKGKIVQFERFGFVRLDDKEKREFILSC